MSRNYALSPLAALISILAAAGDLRGQEIKVDAGRVIGRVSRQLTGACIEDVNHEIYGGIYSQMIFGESFQEPSPPPAIGGFKTIGGHWLVVDGTVRIRAGDGPKLVSDRAAFKDGAIGVELRFADRDAGNAGLIVRVDQPGVGPNRFIGYEVSLDAGRQRLLLARHRKNFEPIEDVPCEVPVDRWVPLEVRLSGPVIEILVDGKSILRHDDRERALPSGAVGLRAWRREASFRSLWVKAGGDDEKLALEPTEEIAEVSGMWRAVRRGTARGSFALSSERPFVGSQSQRLTFDSGEGECGVENQGLNRWGMGLVEGRAYEGYVWARADRPTTLVASLESRDGTHGYAETKLNVTGNAWQRFDFTLTPNATDVAGRFALKLRQPGSIGLGFAFLQPGEWGRFRGLPVRRDVAEGLIDQGITVLRYGGSMVNNEGYRWKKMIGPRDRRPPYAGHWYPYSSNGWSILDFMDFCEAAGFEYIPDFDINETPEDIADFIEYAKGPADSEWGRKRVADGHPKPYRLPYMELGNEERVDEEYAARFERHARSIWARDRDVVLVVGDFLYVRPIVDPMNFTGAASKINNLKGHAKVLSLAREHDREVWFDAHVVTDGPGPSPSLMALPTYIDALNKVSSGAKHRVEVFEYNANNHDVRRALGNALATNVIERDARLPVVTSANGLQPDDQNDNGWDQGLLFLNSSRVWLQPPGYVTQMLARNYLPRVLKCEVSGAEDELDATAKLGEDGATLSLQVVNVADRPIETTIRIARFSPGSPVAQVTELSGPLDAVNVADNPNAIVPRHSRWKCEMREGKASRIFPAHSFTIIRWGKN
jgi:hypothetical protein